MVCYEVPWIVLTGSTPPPPSCSVTKFPLEGRASGPRPDADPLRSQRPGARDAYNLSGSTTTLALANRANDLCARPSPP